MKALHVISIGLSILSLVLCDNYHEISDVVFVDYLTNDYLLTEMNIWNDISSNKHLKEVIQKVQSEHLNLFSNSFLASETTRNALFLNRKESIGELIAEVNVNMKTVKENYLRNTIDSETSRGRILEMAKHNANTTLIDRIYDSVTQEDYFGYVGTVILFVAKIRIEKSKKQFSSQQNSKRFIFTSKTSHLGAGTSIKRRPFCIC